MVINVKALLLLTLVLCSALHLVAGKPRRQWSEGGDVSSEEVKAEEEEMRRQEGIEKERQSSSRYRHHHRDEKEEEEEEERGHKKERSGEDIFILGEGKRVARSEAGEIRVVKGYGYGGGAADSPERPLHVGFITMEPRSLFVPQYMDSSLVLFVQRGEAKLGLIYNDALVERRLRTGDIYRVPAGSAFYIINTAEGQRLHLISSVDPSEGLGLGPFESFFIGGGSNPTSVLAGFGTDTLSAAMNVSKGELKDLMTSQEAGPFVYIDSHVPTPFADFDSLDKQHKLEKLKRATAFTSLNTEDDDEDEEHKPDTWSFSTLFNGLLGKDDKQKKREKEGDVGTGPDPFNLYEATPGFKNNYGSTIAVDKHLYKPLKKSHLGVYYVNLTAGTMLAPHVNPIASEYGVVLRGSGRIQIVYPNGTTAVDAKVKQGSVFWVPRYFPFCQIASRSGPLEFFGFATSAERNHPQFLVGASSVLKTLQGPELAAGFGVTEERLRKILDAQREVVALPSPGASPGGEGGGADMPRKEDEEEKKEKKLKMVRRGVKVFGREMVMA